MKGPLFLGIDGGATHCRARIVGPGGQTLGEGQAGTANPRYGLDAAVDEITAAARQALGAAGLPDSVMASLHAGLGLAGTGQRRDRDDVLAHPHPFATLALATDAHAACLGAHGGRDGAILILGTGSCGWAIVEGRPRRIGGLGFPISDHGSGAWLGLMTIRRSLLAHDGVEPETALSKAVLARFDGDTDAAVAWQSDAQPKDFGALAPLVIDHAAAGDPLATELMRASAADAAKLAEALLATGVSRLSLMGGLAPHIRPWLPAPLGATIVEPAGDALDGAILLAQLSIEKTGNGRP